MLLTPPRRAALIKLQQLHVGLQVVMLAAPTTLAAAATQGRWDPTLVVVSVVQMILVAAATLALLAQVVAVRFSPDAH